MCLILFAYNYHPRYPLVLAAHRDEYYDRPTAPADFRPDIPGMLAGRDLRCGGTWLGVTKTGKIAALANHREMQAVCIDAPSRGFLVSDFLQREIPADHYLEKLQREGQNYNGFGLIFGDIRQLLCFSNRDGGPRVIEPGVHGQGNHLMDTPWPKVVRGKKALRHILSSENGMLEKELFALLADRARADDHMLPDGGKGIETERILSSIFVTGPIYGTRSSTVVLIDSDNTLTFIERTFDRDPEHFTTVQFRFKVQGQD